MKEITYWYSSRIESHVCLTRWGHYGAPVLLFPTAGGDAGEVERFHLIGALWPLIEQGRIKVYSCDSVAGRAWVSRQHSPRHCSWLQNQYLEFLRAEVAPAVRSDCHSPDIELISAGASIGAFNAVAALCRHPDLFRLAIGMSGSYDLDHYLHGEMNADFYFSSPLHYLPGLSEGGQLERLRRRFVLLATGEGRWEDPSQSWRMAHVLGSRNIPNQVDAWGPGWDHDWPTWRHMLPHYLENACR